MDNAENNEQIPQNEYVESFSDSQRIMTVLSSYIEQHPEDAEKWMDFYKNTVNKKNIAPIDMNINIETAECLKMYPGERLDVEFTGDNMCTVCKRTWESTVGHPTITLLCGHVLHTMCWLLWDSYYDIDSRCGYPGCTLDTRYVANIVHRQIRKNVNTVNTIISDAIVNKDEFKRELNNLKKSISIFNKHHSALVSNARNAKKELIKKHKYNLAQFQQDMNKTVKSVREGMINNECKKALRKYRRLASNMYQKYNLSLRDLRDRRLIRVHWSIGYILERHGVLYHSYKFGVRIYPGNRKWENADT